MPENNSWRVEMIESAQEKIDEAIELITDAVKKTEIEDAVHSYVIPSLKMCAHKEHGYLASQPYNCDEIIESLENPEEEDEEDEEEEIPNNEFTTLSNTNRSRDDGDGV